MLVHRVLCHLFVAKSEQHIVKDLFRSASSVHLASVRSCPGSSGCCAMTGMWLEVAIEDFAREQHDVQVVLCIVCKRRNQACLN